MSTTTPTSARTPALARTLVHTRTSTARAIDGLIAGYVRSLVRAACGAQ
jgi:hypothetical protein